MESTPQFKRQEIIDQQNRILEFPVFKNSMILSEFLKFIIKESWEGRSNMIKEYTIGVKVLSKKSEYDPQADASVRIHAGRLRKALNEYYQGVGAQDPILISIPKGAYIPIFQSKNQEELNSFTIQENIYKPTLAVFPFHVESNPELQSFADGLCDQICTEFGSFNELSVVSYYSSRKLASEGIGTKEAGLMLDSTFLLTGSIQSSVDLIRIRVQLIQCNTQHQIWANTYDRKKSHLENFTIQDEIVKHVINQIGGSHGIIFREAAKASPLKTSHDVKVYDAIFWYYHLLNHINEPTFKKGLQVMRNTVDFDPQYALGWAILGETYVAGFFYGFDCHIQDPLEEAVKCGKKALGIDPLCEHTYQTLGLAYLFQHKWKECRQIIHQWENLHSNSTGIAGGLGFCLICLGEYDKGYNLLCESIQVNPYYPWWFNAGLSFYHFQKQEFEDSIYWAEKIQGQSPIWELILKIASLAEMRDFISARGLYDQLIQIVPDLPNRLNSILSSFLQSEQLVEQLAKAIEKVQSNETKNN